MNKKEIAKKVIIESGGIAKTVSLNKAGIQNFEIVKLCEQGEIERVRHGYYQITMNNDVSDEQMIATFFDEAIICMDSALFYYGYSDHTPLAWTLAVPRSMTRSKMNIDTFAYKLYFIQNDQHQIFTKNKIFVRRRKEKERENIYMCKYIGKFMHVSKKVQ